MKEIQDLENSAPKGWGCRHTFALLLSFGSAVSYAMKFNLSTAIVAMVDPTNSVHTETDFGDGTGISNSIVPCAHLLHNATFGEVQNDSAMGDSGGDGEFTWTEVEQGVILGSFFWGYILTQIPGGILAKKFGGKWPFGIGLLVSAIFALLTPLAARTHRVMLIFARVVQGLGSGMQVSCHTTLLAAWAPPNERSSLATIASGGTYVGMAVTLIGSGYLIHGNVLGGWPSVFYVTGLISVLWFILWTLFAFSTPAEHPRISQEERFYIEKSIGVQNTETSVRTPWKDILTSMPMWACFVAHVAHTWGAYTLLMEMPNYMYSVLHFDIQKNSLMNAIPCVTSYIFGIVFANIADAFIHRQYTSLVIMRKSAQIVGHAGSSIALIGAVYSGCNKLMTVIFLTVSVTLTSACNSGYMVSYVDCTPNYAGIIVGVVNTVASFGGVGAPYVTGVLISDNPSLENWRSVFLVSASTTLFAAVFFTIFASGEEQPWNNSQKLDEQQRATKAPTEDQGLLSNTFQRS